MSHVSAEKGAGIGGSETWKQDKFSSGKTLAGPLAWRCAGSWPARLEKKLAPVPGSGSFIIVVGCTLRGSHHMEPGQVKALKTSVFNGTCSTCPATRASGTILLTCVHANTQRQLLEHSRSTERLQPVYQFQDEFLRFSDQGKPVGCASLCHCMAWLDQSITALSLQYAKNHFEIGNKTEFDIFFKNSDILKQDLGRIST